jgi:UDPglucose--hexose-1-phosphate uridylyltransferase
MLDWEIKEKKRIVFENNNFLALCPFASKTAFEVIITPKKHLSYFENITEEEKKDLAEALRLVLKKINKALGNPDYNFYLHTAPCDGEKHNYYHWHWTILPKTSTWGGFEMGTRMEISTIEPEKAAEYLRKQK